MLNVRIIPDPFQNPFCCGSNGSDVAIKSAVNRQMRDCHLHEPQQCIVSNRKRGDALTERSSNGQSNPIQCFEGKINTDEVEYAGSNPAVPITN